MLFICCTPGSDQNELRCCSLSTLLKASLPFSVGFRSGSDQRGLCCCSLSTLSFRSLLLRLLSVERCFFPSFGDSLSAPLKVLLPFSVRPRSGSDQNGLCCCSLSTLLKVSLPFSVRSRGGIPRTEQLSSTLLRTQSYQKCCLSRLE